MSKKISLPKAEIQMNVRDDSDFLSPYSKNNNPIIASDVAEFLENSALGHPITQKLELNIYSDCIDNEKKETYSEAIHNYYNQKATEIKRNIRISTITAIVFISIGVIVLSIMVILGACNIDSIWLEVGDIFAWVFIWGSVDQFFIQRINYKREFIRNKRLGEMDINYYNN